mmetsp:Transcript_15435/g.47765  ORF Transcript_15435/g.47765 Transcript_15435/m.47765 type:complete len:222 (+) Transcript_15435:4005-4670(+)
MCVDSCGCILHYCRTSGMHGFHRQRLPNHPSGTLHHRRCHMRSRVGSRDPWLALAFSYLDGMAIRCNSVSWIHHQHLRVGNVSTPLCNASGRLHCPPNRCTRKRPCGMCRIFPSNPPDGCNHVALERNYLRFRTGRSPAAPPTPACASHERRWYVAAAEYRCGSRRFVADGRVSRKRVGAEALKKSRLYLVPRSRSCAQQWERRYFWKPRPVSTPGRRVRV